LTQSKYHETLLPIEKKDLVFINNTSNMHLDIMRPTMLFSGLEAIVHNQNRQHANLRFFEFGRTYKTVEEGHKEKQHLSLFLTGQLQSESWLGNNKDQVDYYTLKAAVNNVLQRLGVAKYQEDKLKDAIFVVGMKYYRGQQVLATFGKVQSSITKGMGIKNAVWYADINFDAGDIIRVAKSTVKKHLATINLFDVYQNEEQLGPDKKSYAVSFIFEDKTKTLKDKEVDKVMNKLIQAFEQKIGAQIRR